MSRTISGGRVRPPLCLLALVAALTFAAVAHAQQVVLVRPERSDAVLTEAFNRLRGELAMHGFEVLVVAEEEAPTATSLARVAEEKRAVASVSFVTGGAGATADIWLSDRVTGKTSIRTISTAGSSDAPSLLALRAVELLRASLREYGPERAAPPDVVDARPERSEGVAKRWSAPPAQPTSSAPWRLGAELLCGTSFPSGGPSPSFGPGISFGRELGSRFGLGLGFGSLMLGSEVEVLGATASVRRDLGMLELDALVYRADPVRLRLRLSLGATRVTARGEAEPPWFGRSETAWVGTAGPGLGATLSITPAVSAALRGRVLATAPRATLRLADERRTLDMPLVLASLGIEASF